MNSATAQQRTSFSPNHLLLASALLLGLLWVGLWNQLRIEWSINPQYNYGWGVPFLALYLLLKRWADRPLPQPYRFAPVLLTLLGLLLLALFPVRVIQEANPDWRAVSWGGALAVVALTLLAVYFAGGWSWLRHFSFPILFLLVAVPWPTPMESLLIQSLMKWVATITVEGLNWLGILARRHGNLIELSTGLVGINEACSGVRSFQSTLMIALFLGELNRFSLAQRFGLLGSGLLLAFLLNVARAFTLTWLCAQKGTNSLESWHDPAGYLVFAFSFAGLLVLTLVWKRKNDPPSESETAPTALPRPFPVGVLAAAAIWLALIEMSTEAWYRYHEQTLTQRLAWSVKWPSPSENFQLKPLDEQLQLTLRCDVGQTGNWRHPEGSNWSLFFLRWSPGRTAAQLARSHAPDVCLPASGLKMRSELGTQMLRARGIDLPFQTYIFESRGRPLYVYFCLWEDRALPQSTMAQGPTMYRSSRMRAVLEGRRHLGQQVFEVAIGGVSTEAEARRQLEEQLQQMIQVTGQKG